MFSKCLGVKFSTNLKDMVNMNYTQVLDSIKNVITMWSKRFLTVYGRVTVVKCFMLSKFNYIGQMLPNPSDEFLREVNEYIFKFIWNGKPDRIKRSQMIQDKSSSYYLPPESFKNKLAKTY